MKIAPRCGHSWVIFLNCSSHQLLHVSVLGGKFLSLSGQEGLSFAHIYHGWISSFIFVVSPEQNVSFEQKSKSQTKIMTLQAKVSAF